MNRIKTLAAAALLGLATLAQAAFPTSR